MAISARNQRRLDKKEIRREVIADRSTRRCGECTACCTVLGVEELEKPAYTPCSQICGAGCQVYKNRPTTCRTYSCAWKIGALPDEFFPPRAGFIVDTTNELGAITVREIEPGSASNSFGAKRLVNALAAQSVTVVVRGEHDRTILGPVEKVKAFMKQVDKRMKQQGVVPG